MIRYDQQDAPVTPVKKDEKKELVILDSKHMQKIVDLFKNELKALKVNNVKIVNNITHDTIQLNPKISVELLGKALGKPLESKIEFIKEFYMYNLDRYINEAYGKPVTAVQEFPYSFNIGTNENLITFEFIV